jgi:hypothetical protein
VISYTGFVLEFASEGCSGTVPVYRVDEGHGGIGDLVFLEKDAICKVRLLEIPRSEPHPGKPYSLESLITALYLNHRPATHLTDLLNDYRAKIELKAGNKRRRADFKGLLRNDIEDAGFELIELRQYGRTLTVSFAWVFQQDRKNPHALLCLYAGAFECKPALDRTLGKGKWLMPMPTIIGCLFSNELKEVCRGNPVNLLTDEGKEIALETFKWTKVSLLAPSELRKERLEFVRQHRDLHQNPRELAKRMKTEGLYSNMVEIYVIVKQLTKLIEEAGRL